MQLLFLLDIRSSVVVGQYLVPFAEKQRNAPQSRNGDQRKDDAADDGTRPAEDPGNDVELKQSDASPVDRTDHDQKQICPAWLFTPLIAFCVCGDSLSATSMRMGHDIMRFQSA